MKHSFRIYLINTLQRAEGTPIDQGKDEVNVADEYRTGHKTAYVFADDEILTPLVSDISRKLTVSSREVVCQFYQKEQIF